MAETVKYPTYHTFFHKENEPMGIVKCHQCGKEISENKGCVCLQCGSYIGEEIYQENEVLVKQVISGYVESSYEHEKNLITNEVFEERMKTLEKVSKKIKDSSNELEYYHKNKHEATNKLGTFQNSLLFRFTYAYYSFIYTLARPKSKGYDGVDGIDLGYSIVFGIFGAFLLFGATFGKGFGAVLLTLISLLFIMVPIVAVVERILGNKPNENEFLKRWTYWKHAVHSRLWVYFSQKTYQEKGLGDYYVSGLEDLVNWHRDSTKKPYDEEDLRLMKAAMGLMGYQILLIEQDYLVSKGEESAESIDRAKNAWRDLYERYEA